MNDTTVPTMMQMDEDRDEAVFNFGLMMDQLCATMDGCPPFQHQNQPVQSVLSGPSRPRRNDRYHTVTPYPTHSHGSLATIPRDPAGTHPQMDANSNNPGSRVSRTRRKPRTTMPTSHDSHIGNRRTHRTDRVDPREFAARWLCRRMEQLIHIDGHLKYKSQ